MCKANRQMRVTVMQLATSALKSTLSHNQLRKFSTQTLTKSL